MTDKEFFPSLDPGIARAVRLLHGAGIETHESCEGGPGHAYPEPTIAFGGQRDEGFRALALALQHSLPVDAVKRVWTVVDGEPTGPVWHMTFWKRMTR